jgi:hypothetical protein
MRPWKAMWGLVAACAACCAIPLLGLAAGLAGFSAFAAAVQACANEFLPAALVPGAVAAIGMGVWWIRRHRTARGSGCGCARSWTTSCQLPYDARREVSPP